MISEFRTNQKLYQLKVDRLCCNKFGLAELFVKLHSKLSLPPPHEILDVGCGAGPLGIYFADQFRCNVVGVELNPIACACCRENLEALDLTSHFRLVHDDFRKFEISSGSTMFDLIVSVPPIDPYVSSETVQHYAGQDFQIMDPRSFAFLTNSWHDENYNDLLDLIFRYGQTHLREDGRIVITFCTIDCKDPTYVTRKAEYYRYTCVEQIEKTITAESVGIGDNAPRKIRAFVMNFRLEKGTPYEDPNSSGI